MYFSPSPIRKRHTSSIDQLHRYLPQMEQSRSQKQQALYFNFSTVQQIAKSIDIEKERLDEQNTIFCSALNQCSNIVVKAKKQVSGLKHKIQNIQFDSDQKTIQELPQIPLQSVFYTLNEKPKYSSSLKKDQIQMLLSEIEKLEKNCAKLYCEQNEKCQSFEQVLMMEFDTLNDKLIKGNHSRSDCALLELKIIENNDKIQKNIKQWECQLNQEFQDKILHLIEKIQNPK